MRATESGNPTNSLLHPTWAADERIPVFIEVAEKLRQGQFQIEVPTGPADGLGRLGSALRDLALSLEHSYREVQELEAITNDINTGLLLDEILDKIYHDFRGCIPYDRIGCALIDPDGQAVRARWARAEYPDLQLLRGYSAPLEGSSLQDIMTTGKPRILNDLVEYLRAKPNSESTRMMVAEGVRASLTCPLVANGVPVGFLFFSSRLANTYAIVHIRTYQRLAQQISVIVEKGRLVSQLAEQKAAIEHQNEELRRLSELKNRFLGMVAHDLRNPIGNVQSIAALLLGPAGDLTDAERRSFLEDVHQQATYMLPLLNDLLDVTQLESSRLRLHREPLNLGVFLGETVARHHLLAEPKQTQVVLGTPPVGSPLADPVRLRQVLDNLISNAVKFSPRGSVVQVRAHPQESTWRIEVQDQGPGLTPRDREQLFQEFARLSAKPTGDEKSTGLGLAISRRVVEAHGGQIGVDSEPGQGATFWFTLPA